MTSQPRKVGIQHKPGSERSWGYRTRDRLDWVMSSLAVLPTPVWQVMMVLIQHADNTGRTFPSLRTIRDSTDLAPAQIELALADAEALDLIRPAGLSDYGTPAWVLQEGQKLPDPLPLFTKAVNDKIRVLLPHVGALQYILLEAMVDIGYRWMDNTIHTTTKQLLQRLPGFTAEQLRDCLHRLCSTPYITRLKKGYGDRPSIFQLEFSAVAEAARGPRAARRRISYRTANLGPEQLSGNNKVDGGQLSGNNKVAGRQLSGNNKVAGRQLSGNNKVAGRQLSGNNKVAGRQLSGNNSSSNTPFKEPTIIKPTIFKPSSSSSKLITNSPGSDDDDDDMDQKRFLTTFRQTFQDSIPGAPGVWRRSYAANALTVVQPYHAHFGHYPPDEAIIDLLARCDAYAARTWAYVRQVLAEWIAEQVDAHGHSVVVPAARRGNSAPRTPDERAKQVWEDALQMMKPSVTRPLYDTCLSKTRGLSWTDGVFTIEAPNQAMAALIEDRLYNMLSATLQRVLESPVDVAIESPVSDDQAEE